MLKKVKKILLISLPAAIFYFPLKVLAAGGLIERLNDLAKKSGYQTGGSITLGSMVATLIEAFLSLLGLIFLILMLVAGFNWMTAGGDAEKVRTAQNTITKAIIGIIIIMAAYAITYFVFKIFGSGGSGGGGGAISL